MSLFIRRLLPSFLLCVTFSTALAEDLNIDIAVLDPESFALGAPKGDTRWVIEGAQDFVLAEQHGALPSMSFDLPAGQYRVTVWEVDSKAAAEQVVTLPEGGAAEAALTLSVMNRTLVAEVLARTSKPEPKAAVAREARPEPRASAPEESVRAKGAIAPLGLVAAPGDIIELALPQIADASNDRLALSDGGQGWIWSSERGSRDVMALSAPKTPGAYTVEYLQVPEMTVLVELELRVR